jgi:hypothetical protein
VSSFCPDGYVLTQVAILEALAHWFPERLAESGIPGTANLTTEDRKRNQSGVESLANALAQRPISSELQQTLEDLLPETVHRLRNIPYQGKRLTAYYFGSLFSEGRNAVSADFWATDAADGILEQGRYFPFGRPSRSFDQKPGYLFLQMTELDFVLDGPEPDYLQQDPPGPRPGQTSGKDPACRAVLSILNDQTQRPPRRHGRFVLSI